MEFELWMLLELCKVMTLSLIIAIIANALIPQQNND